MKTRIYSFVVLFFVFAVTGYSQTYTHQRTVTNPESGVEIQTIQNDKPTEIAFPLINNPSSRTPEINWQHAEPAGIGSKIVVSGESGYTFNSWWLNDERASLYGNSATALWESPVPTDWEYPIDMTPNGAYLNIAFDSVVQVFSSSTQTLVWEKITNATIIGTKISEDGSKVFVVENMPDGQDKSIVSAYTVGENDPLWQTTFAGAGTTFAASGDRSTLVFCQYGGFNKLWVIDASNGDIIYDNFYKNQNPPALSYDGKVILSGDYSGYAYLYEYQENSGEYVEKWNFKVGGGGTSAWVVGMDVSADGSTAVIGTLVFLTGGYDGEIYTFNTYSPEPLWVFEHAGDQVTSVAVSDDGSIIAAGGYGPIDHSKPDFYVFRKQSNLPLFYINTPGSFNAVDISGDGMLCSVTGKAVHAREFGSGGLLFNVSSDPGGGTLSGNINVDNVKVEITGIDDYYAYSNEAGSYNVKFIPEGTYIVKASKVGYYPVMEEGVQISEGNVTNLDFAMVETGDPPTGLIATHGSGYTVMLSWDYADPASVLGFNIYRKTIAEAQFPEEPLQSVSNTNLQFEDSDVQPLKNYYYSVTAILEADVESPYSNIAEGWMAHGFVINSISAYPGTTPTIDGTIDEGEWDDAFMMDASDFLGIYDNLPNPVGSVWMAYKVNAEMTELYVACINENDTQLEDHDEVALYIDDNNDGAYPPSGDDSEGNYWAAYYAGGNELKYRPIYNNGGVGTVFYLENPQLEVSDATGVIVYEFMIPIGDDENWKINPNDDNQSGFFLFVLDDPTNFDGYWPCQNLQIFEPTGYGTITFGAEDVAPVSPDQVSIWWDAVTPPITIILEWNQPDINDFDHFNVYSNMTGSYEIFTETEGTQLFYITDSDESIVFYVTTVDKAGNESDASELMVFDVTVGVEETAAQPQISVYPNPGTEKVNFSFYNDFAANANIAVYDLTGNLIEVLHQGNLNSGNHNFNWQAINRPSGIYILKIANGESVISKKFLLMH